MAEYQRKVPNSGAPVIVQVGVQIAVWVADLGPDFQNFLRFS